MNLDSDSDVDNDVEVTAALMKESSVVVIDHDDNKVVVIDDKLDGDSPDGTVKKKVFIKLYNSLVLYRQQL